MAVCYSSTLIKEKMQVHNMIKIATMHYWKDAPFAKTNDNFIFSGKLLVFENHFALTNETFVKNHNNQAIMEMTFFQVM